MNTKDFIKNLKVSYDSGFGDNLGKDFYSPCLDRCKEYKRMTGEFTSNVIFDWGRALLKVLNNEDDKCMVKIIANPSLNQYDIDTLRGTLQHRNDDEFWEKLSDQIYEEAENLVNKDLDRKEEREVKLKIFAYLISTKKLIIKFAFPKHVPSPGMFHVKKGIFYFEDDLKVGFNGGPNESHGGHELNIEGIDVFHNCYGENPHIKDSEEKFDLAWVGDAPGFLTKTLSQKTLNKIKINAPNTKIELDQIIKKAYEKKKDTLGDLLDEEQIEKLKNISLKIIKEEEEKENYLDVTEKKWEFQKKARETFIEKKWGICEMATGTGKTRTALSIATQLINDKKIDKIIIQMYGSDLIKQWTDNLRDWSNSKISREVNILNDEKKDIDFFLLNYNNPDVDVIIVRQSKLSDLLDNIKDNDQSKVLIIHDEVHDLFAEQISENIIGKQNKFGYKLGLSATIREEFDKEREKKLFQEIQGGGEDPIFEYTLSQAIEDGVLVEMDVISLEYELDEEEKAEITKAYAQHKADLEEGIPKWKADANRNMKIADIRKNAKDKIVVFENNLNKLLSKLNRSFIFADETKYGDKLLNILIHHLDVKTHYGNTDKDNLERFSKKELNCIINIMKLSQGIDVQNLNTIVLFATPRGRQFIQRLGRVLRIDPNNKDKKALVIDFFDKKHMKDKKGSDYNRYLELKKYSKIKRKIL